MKLNELFSIYIPTYNRHNFLKDCLNTLFPEVREYRIKIYISDNCSTHETSELIADYKKKYEYINYVRHDVQITMDENQMNFLNMVDTKFSLLLADDDGLLTGAVPYIKKTILSNKNLDCLLLNAKHVSADFKIPGHDNYEIDSDKIYNSEEEFITDNYFHMHFSTLLVNVKKAKNVEWRQYHGTFHAYCGVVIEYLKKNVEDGLNSLMIQSKEPWIMLRDGEKTYHKAEVHFSIFPSFFKKVPESFATFSRVKLRELTRSITNSRVLMNYRINRKVSIFNFREYRRYLTFTEKLKLLFFSISPVWPLKLVKEIFGKSYIDTKKN